MTAVLCIAYRVVSAVLLSCIAACAVDGTAEQSAGPATLNYLTFSYEEPQSGNLRSIAEALRAARVLEVWTQQVNATLKPLPHGIQAVFAECANDRSRYDDKRDRITLCYEEAALRLELLNAPGHEGSVDPLTAWTGSMLHELYHELAHALIDVLSLPVFGSEEQGADQFGVIALLAYTDGWKYALGAADYFRELANIELDIGLDPSSVHLFLVQRHYNVLCMTYGSDPGKHHSLVEQGRLPSLRAADCRVEYLQAVRGWGSLLKPAVK